MNYQGEINVLGGVTTVTAGVAVLPNTGEVPVLLYVGVAAIVTGITLLGLQTAVWFYRRKTQ